MHLPSVSGEFSAAVLQAKAPGQSSARIAAICASDEQPIAASSARVKPVAAGRSGGGLFLPIYATYSLDDIAEALALMRSNQHFGKIAISIR